MLADERAMIHNENGKVKSIKLTESAQSHATRVGEASALTGPATTSFARRVKSDLGVSWIEHHPRALER